MNTIIRLLLALVVSFTVGNANAASPVREIIRQLQVQNESFHSLNVFRSPTQRSVEEIGTYIHYELDVTALQNAFKANYPSIKVMLPTLGGEPVVALLTKHQILTDDFRLSITNARGEQQTAYTPGLYYHGIIEGREHSIAAFSVFNNHLTGVISDENGNWNLGPLEEGGKPMNEYAYFSDRLFNLPLFSSCGTDEDLVNLGDNGHPFNQRSLTTGNCVRIFIDCDYDFYLYKSSSATTVANYVTTLFNVESTIYGNESIGITLSEINVWTVVDPFNKGNSRSNMDSYSDYRRTDFNGDLAQLIARDEGGLGGIAWINVLCANYSSTSHFGPVSYCDISGGYSVSALTFPTYTWDANVTSHEMGHNFGSRHTHWCGWSSGPIDNCNTCWSPPIAFDGSCTSGPNPPATGGTIMSYCHGCSGVGISLLAGFGPQPGDLIRSGVAAASCLAGCESPSGCLPVVSVELPVITGNIQYEASDIIYGNNSIQSGATAAFTAGNAVILTAGFNAQAGSDFTASIVPCSGSASAPSIGETHADSANAGLVNSLTASEQKRWFLSAFPNPFSQAVTIQFRLPVSGKVRIELAGIDGRVLATLYNGQANEGQLYAVKFEPNELENGMYFCRMTTELGGMQNKKLLLIR